MRRGRKQKPGRIMFVGSGPGDPGLLTTRARTVLANAALVFTDPDVPEAVLALAGSELPPASGPEPAEAAKPTDRTPTAGCRRAQPIAACGDVIPGGPDIRPALGDPAEVAKTLATEARTGVDVVRLVAGDPLSVDSVITEVNAVAQHPPGLRDRARPARQHRGADVCGPAAGLVAHRGRRPRRRRLGGAGRRARPADPARHRVSSARRGAHADRVRADRHHAVRGHRATAPPASSVRSRPRWPVCIDKRRDRRHEPAGPLAGPLVVTIGKTVANRAKLNWWESRALYGWTVLVPRTKDQAGEMSERLVSHGALPIEVPTIAVEPPRSPAQMERAVKGLVDGRFQWVVFTSTNAVRAVWEKFNEFGLDARAFSGVKIACVGQATADRVRAFGINPELVPSGEQSSLGLLDEFPPYDDVFDPVNRVLLPRADIATETLAEGLRERGWEIEDVTAYRTVRAAPPPAQTREMIKTGGFDAVCFTSSSTVRNLVGIAGKPHARTIVACIGPKTAETAAEFGLRVDVQPETAAVGPLVEALAEHAARLRAEGALPPPRKKSRRR